MSPNSKELKYPTPKELKAFARRFDKSQWDFLCKSQEFLDTFTEDLIKSAPLAEKILAKQSKVLTVTA